MKLKFVHSTPLGVLFCLVSFLAKVKIFRLKIKQLTIVRRFDQN